MSAPANFAGGRVKKIESDNRHTMAQRSHDPSGHAGSTVRKSTSPVQPLPAPTPLQRSSNHNHTVAVPSCDERPLPDDTSRSASHTRWIRRKGDRLKKGTSIKTGVDHQCHSKRSQAPFPGRAASDNEFRRTSTNGRRSLSEVGFPFPRPPVSRGSRRGILTCIRRVEYHPTCRPTSVPLSCAALDKVSMDRYRRWSISWVPHLARTPRGHYSQNSLPTL